MNVRRLEPSDVALFVSIDRSEHVEVQYRIEHGRLVEAPVFMADIPTWDSQGSGEHSVASQIAFCVSVVADGGALLGAFDDDGELMGLATVHPTFESGLAWLATLHVSRAHRRRGAASALWDAGVALAREAGAHALYVSATPTGSAVGFYLGRGCRLADPVHPELFAQEPEDIHLVCPWTADERSTRCYSQRLIHHRRAPGTCRYRYRHRCARGSGPHQPRAGRALR
jgi:ribosomal protein S18 acetylase RimI-like enzyme